MSDPNRILRRAKRVDRLMGAVIRVGGLTIIAAVIGILLFIGKEALPLFLPPRVAPVAPGVLPPPQAIHLDESGKALFAWDLRRGLGAYTLPGPAARELPPGPPLPWTRVLPPDARGTALVLAADGKFYSVRPSWDKPAGENDPGQWKAEAAWSPALDPGPQPCEPLAFRKVPGSGLGGGDTLRLAGRRNGVLAWTEAPAEASGPLAWTPLPLPGAEAQAASWSADASQLFVGTSTGRLLVFDPPSGQLLREAAFSQPVSALGWVLGGTSLLVGGRGGALEAFQQVRVGDAVVLQSLRAFPPLQGEVLGLAASQRDKRFLSWSAESLAVDHLTTGRRLLSAPAQGLQGAALSPRGDLILGATAQGQLRGWTLEAPHPEVSWGTLWRPTRYEGYAEPQRTWQSTGGTDDFEPKLSLLPLLFGTLKGTFYALLFALPVAIFGALYTSQFAHPALRNLIKPTVEVMAALPSVVLGFLAGLVLAPMFERSMVQFVIVPPVALSLALLAMPLWARLPRAFRKLFGEGREALWMVPLLLGAFGAAMALAPWIERALLGGEYRLWLQSHGIPYDQRNSIVVGFAMGFAVIPIIFTISEDALSSVPRSLSSASLACGASPWQTAWRVVLPTASPGIFSAAMVGLGRAVGETMIVLMATGNTPVMEWNPFNGMRTLAANIAVEVPEAPQHGSLYRVLFLTALLLFLLTFVLNSAAELIRQRLRKRYEAL
ncbi:MAG: ABC transporter permease subunit [Acidobacteria bacterium]|nr:ABC transporter permease subunit [Acidobacteriota bacterium]